MLHAVIEADLTVTSLWFEQEENYFNVNNCVLILYMIKCDIGIYIVLHIFNTKSLLFSIIYVIFYLSRIVLLSIGKANMMNYCVLCQYSRMFPPHY